MSNNYTLIIRPVEGKTGIVPAKRNYRIRFRNTREANDVIVYIDNEKQQVDSYIEDTDFIVEVNDISTVGQLTIGCKGNDIEIDAVRLVNKDIEGFKFVWFTDGMGWISARNNLKDNLREIPDIKKYRNILSDVL